MKNLKKPLQSVVNDSEPIPRYAPTPDAGLNSLPKTVRPIKIDSYVESIPDKYKKLYLRAKSGNCSPRSAIKAKCYDCMNYEDVVNRVSECSTETCPVWGFRPVKKAGSD